MPDQHARPELQSQGLDSRAGPPGLWGQSNPAIAISPRPADGTTVLTEKELRQVMDNIKVMGTLSEV